MKQFDIYTTSFVKNVKILKENEITNPKISKRIKDYETGNSKLISVSIDKLKENFGDHISKR